MAWIMVNHLPNVWPSRHGNARVTSKDIFIVDFSWKVEEHSFELSITFNFRLTIVFVTKKETSKLTTRRLYRD
jgi:hypothetical protein